MDEEAVAGALPETNDTNDTGEDVQSEPQMTSEKQSGAPKDDADLIREVANAPTPAIVAAAEEEDAYEPSDIFAWANNLYQYKDQLTFELFLINKNNVMYSVKLVPELSKQLKPLFLDNILDYVLNGAAEGLLIRDFEDGEAEDNVLQRTRWAKIDKLVEVMHWIRTQESEIVQFSDEEHDLKRIKAVMARVTHPGGDEPFYIIKALPRAQMMKGDGSWMVSKKVFMPFEDAVALKIPADNQLLVLHQDVFVFSQPKLRTLFGYDAKKNSIAAKKVEAIQEKFDLRFAEGEDMQTMVKGNKAIINKLQKLELNDDITKDKILDHGEELDVALMTDETGAIIIENPKDLAKFINLLNDDYIESNLTGVRYEIQKKRELKPPKEDE